MLVLTRNEEQSLIFRVNGIEFNVAILQVRGNKVRVGIDAPKEVVVIRSEIDHETGSFGGHPNLPHAG